MTDISTLQELRQRLAEIDAELRALPADAFAPKHELHHESDQHKESIRELLSSKLEGVGQGWAERSARKASHTVDYEQKAAVARIPSPGER